MHRIRKYNLTSGLILEYWVGRDGHRAAAMNIVIGIAYHRDLAELLVPRNYSLAQNAQFSFISQLPRILVSCDFAVVPQAANEKMGLSPLAEEVREGGNIPPSALLPVSIPKKQCDRATSPKSDAARPIRAQVSGQ